MSASTYVGRIGALAAAFGVGAAIFTGPAVAWADPASSDTSGPSAPDSAAGSSAAADTAAPTRGRAAHSARTPRTADSTASQSSPKTDQSASDATAADIADTVPRDLTPRRTSDSAESAPKQADVSPSPAAATSAKADNDTPAVGTVAADVAVNTPEADPSPAASLAGPAPAAAQTVTSLVEAVTTTVAPAPSISANAVTPAVTFPTVLANVASQISTVVNSVVTQLVNTFSGTSPFGPQVDSPANWLLLAAARRQPLAAAATGAAQAGATATPTLILNGYSVVPTSIEIIDAFSGRWAYFPGQPNMLQGRQDFDLVDPSTGDAVGSFSALVTSGDPTSIGARYVEMLVTANDGINVGTAAGQTPPVGSLISDFTLGLVGVSYSSMPSPTGNKVSVKLKTPFVTIPLPLSYDASEGVADHTFDNRPMEITGGFTIAPADPVAEKITGAVGFLPLFNSLQGKQVFGIFDSTGKKVGSFDGTFTTTSDLVGIYTQEILVTGNDGTNVGTNPGQTPPVGTVYNVAYFGSDKVWLLYSSMPQGSGDVISIKVGTPQGVTNIPNVVFKDFNASKEPAMKSLTAPGGQKFVATSPVIPAGINGLPPRDMQTQGYQQFDVVDFLGRKIGTIDADVQSQWDGFGIHSKSILITKVTSGKVGATPLDVPPVGTVMNFIDFGNGFGIADSVIPQGGVDVAAFQFVTALGNIPLLPSIVPANRPEVVYVNPFI
jgi:hypothetical protein